MLNVGYKYTSPPNVTFTLQFEQHFWAAEHSDSFFNLHVIWSQQGSVSSQFSKLPQSQSSFSSTILLPQCWLGLVTYNDNNYFSHHLYLLSQYNMQKLQITKICSQLFKNFMSLIRFYPIPTYLKFWADITNRP